LKLWIKKVLRREPVSENEKKLKKQERMLLILSGILLGLSFPPFPFPFTLLLFIGFIPYLYVIERKNTLLEISRSSYLAFFVFNLITLYWVGSWQSVADPFLMISGALLVFVNPVFFLIPATLFFFSRKFFSFNISLLLLPFFWVCYEYLYMITDLSFPWLTLGNGLSVFTSFIQIADIIGVLGLTAIILFINIFLYNALMLYRNADKKYLLYSVLTLVVFIGILLYGFNRIKSFKISDDKIKVGLIQPNLDPWNKWAGGDLTSFLDLYLGLSTEASSGGAQLLVWPETALPVYLASGLYNDVLDSIYNYLNENDVYLLTGMPDIRYYLNKEEAPDDAKYSKGGNYYYTTYNAIMLLSPRIRGLQRYGKMKLVPFGERVPFVDKLPFLGDLIKWGVGISGWNIGRDSVLFNMSSPVKENDTIMINGVVCYESIYPVLVANFVAKGADFISVVTNDSWYGKLSGPYQHKDFAILRAVENRRAVVRAANGGVSCLINPLGIIEKETGMFTKTFLVVDVPLQKEETFYSHNPLIIPVFSIAFSVWILGLFILKKIKEKFSL
jgi:apolipoprotein N-acyltransferase